MNETTREEHLNFCKRRAIELAEADKLDGATASFMSDMKKHPETAEHPALTLLFMKRLGGGLDTKPEFIQFIKDFA